MADGEKTIKVAGRVIALKPYPDDWEEGACSCGGKVPADKRIDVQTRVYDEKRQKWRWKSWLLFHQDCQIHGCNRSE